MSYEDILKGASNAFTLHYAYINNVAREIGIDSAENISSEVCRMMGAARGQMIKENADLEQFTPEAAAAAARGSIEDDFGIITEPIEESSERIVFHCKGCPVYNGAHAAGMDAGSIEAQCRKAPLAYMDALVKELNPDLKYQLRKFRSSASDSCEEEIVIA